MMISFVHSALTMTCQSEAASKAMDLVQSPYGNYAIQHALEETSSCFSCKGLLHSATDHWSQSHSGKVQITSVPDKPQLINRSGEATAASRFCTSWRPRQIL